VVTDTEIRAVAWTGLTAPAFPRFPREKGLNGVAVGAKASVICQDVSKDFRYLTAFPSTGSEAVFPILSDVGDVVGTIDVESDRRNAFTSDDECFLAECAAKIRPLWKRDQTRTPVGIGPVEREILESLHHSVLCSVEGDRIQGAIERTRHQLRADRNLRIAWETLPLDLFEVLPPSVRSSWVFALRAGATTGAERHPNSHQRVMSVSGEADLQMWEGGTWVSNRLTSRHDAGIAQRWLSIPPDVWHRPVVDPHDDWFVVSFHTTEADQLIEELATNHANPDGALTHASRYVGRRAR
jgi:hypothetical protein